MLMQLGSKGDILMSVLRAHPKRLKAESAPRCTVFRLRMGVIAPIAGVSRQDCLAHLRMLNPFIWSRSSGTGSAMIFPLPRRGRLS